MKICLSGYERKPINGPECSWISANSVIELIPQKNGGIDLVDIILSGWSSIVVSRKELIVALNALNPYAASMHNV